MDEWKTAGRSETVQILRIHKNQRRNTNKGRKIRLAPAYSTMTGLAIVWKNKAPSFATKIKLYKSLVLSILVYRRESWMQTRIWGGESRLLKVNATGGCLIGI